MGIQRFFVIGAATVFVLVSYGVTLSSSQAQNHVRVTDSDRSVTRNQQNNDDHLRYNDPGQVQPVSPQPNHHITRELYFLSDSALLVGRNQLARQEYAAAMQTFNDILKRNSRNVDAMAGVAATYLGLGENKAAGDQIRRTLARDNRHIGANYLFGRYYIRTGNLQQALHQVSVLNMLCGGQSCPEQMALQGEINAAGARALE